MKLKNDVVRGLCRTFRDDKPSALEGGRLPLDAPTSAVTSSGTHT